MTEFQSQILLACPDWRTAQEIANAMPLAYPYGHAALTPRLNKLTRQGRLQVDTTGKWWRWRVS